MMVRTGSGVSSGEGTGVATGTGTKNPEIDCGCARIAITITVIIPAAKIRISPFSTQSTDLLPIKTVTVLFSDAFNCTWS
jgi:hypothetical protein